MRGDQAGQCIVGAERSQASYAAKGQWSLSNKIGRELPYARHAMVMAKGSRDKQTFDNLLAAAKSFEDAELEQPVTVPLSVYATAMLKYAALGFERINPEMTYSVARVAPSSPDVGKELLSSCNLTVFHFHGAATKADCVEEASSTLINLWYQDAYWGLFNKEDITPLVDFSEYMNKEYQTLVADETSLRMVPESLLEAFDDVMCSCRAVCAITDPEAGKYGSGWVETSRLLFPKERVQLSKHLRDLGLALSENIALKEHVARYLVVGKTASEMEVPYQNALQKVPALTSVLDSDCAHIVGFLPKFLSKIQPGGCVRLQQLLRTWLSKQLEESAELTGEAFMRVSAISEFVCSSKDDPEGNKPILDKVAILRRHACAAEAKEALEQGVVAFAADSRYVPSTDLIAAVDKVLHIERDEDMQESLIELNGALLIGLRLQLDRQEASLADTSQHCTFHDAIMATQLIMSQNADANKAAKELRLLMEGGFQYKTRLSEVLDASFSRLAPHKKVEMIGHVSETLKRLRESPFVTQAPAPPRRRDLHPYTAISSKFMADVLANTAAYELAVKNTLVEVDEKLSKSVEALEQVNGGFGSNGEHWLAGGTDLQTVETVIAHGKKTLCKGGYGQAIDRRAKQVTEDLIDYVSLHRILSSDPTKVPQSHAALRRAFTSTFEASVVNASGFGVMKMKRSMREAHTIWKNSLDYRVPGRADGEDRMAGVEVEPHLLALCQKHLV